MLLEATMDEQTNPSRCQTQAGCSEEASPQGAVWPCSGCGEAIRDPVVLRVGSDQQWHTGCLYCEECQCPLAESASCFLRDGRTLCRRDYARIFAEKCRGCGEAVLSTDLVVRAGGQIYHPECLHCVLCGELLLPGDSYTLGPRGPSCQAEHTMPEQQSHAVDTVKRKKEVSGARRRGGVRRKLLGRARGVRVRTVLSASQLRALRSCYSQTPRPDASVKLRLGQLTSLSMRVIRVWFQNKRCKDKRGCRPAGDLTYTAMVCAAARPMVVLSPETPDIALQICIYESPWQLLDSQPKSRADLDDPSATEVLQSSCSSDLESPGPLSDDDPVTLLTM